MGLLSRIFGEAAEGQRDGQAEESIARATGIPTGVLEAGLMQARDGGRRERPLASPRDVVIQAVGEKVLLGWLQNRHQTLYPLTVNIGTLEPHKATLLAHIMAVALLSAAAPVDIAPAEVWFGSVGGNAAALHAALETPIPLARLLHEAQEANIAAYAYVVALGAGAWRDQAGQLFLDYLAARLGLPIEVVRSANRRYRG